MNSPQPPRLHVETLLRVDPESGADRVGGEEMGEFRARSTRESDGPGSFEPVATTGLELEHVTELLC